MPLLRVAERARERRIAHMIFDRVRADPDRGIAVQPVDDPVVTHEMDAVVHLADAIAIKCPALDKRIALPLECVVRPATVIEYLDAVPAEYQQFAMIGYDADLTVVDLKKTNEISNKWIASKCAYTPFDGYKVTGWPIMTIIRGQIVMREDQVIKPHQGAAISFDRN